MQIKIIIGIGNPNKKYENTYHNVGILFIDYLSQLSAENEMKNKNIKILKSDVYMNESGKFVAKALKQNNAKPEELLIAQDDSDIELGNYKLSFDKNSAGHKGVENIIKSLTNKNFWRLRIGIRPKLPKTTGRQKAEKLVLKKITAANKKLLQKVFEIAANEINTNLAAL